MKLNKIHIKHSPHDDEFVGLRELILLALKSRNIELFLKAYLRFSCLLVRDPYIIPLKIDIYLYFQQKSRADKDYMHEDDRCYKGI